MILYYKQIMDKVLNFKQLNWMQKKGETSPSPQK